MFWIGLAVGFVVGMVAMFSLIAWRLPDEEITEEIAPDGYEIDAWGRLHRI